VAETSTIDQILGWLRGPTPTPSLGLEKAPPLASYPSQHDADYARNYGFADNSINEDYLNNNKARVLGQTIPELEPATKKQVAKKRELFLPASGDNSSTTELTDPQNSTVVDLNKGNSSNGNELQGNLTNVMMRAGLAANRSPITAVGFDPSKVIVDSLIQKPAYAGLYSAKRDTAYSALSPDDAVAHESTHRGIQKLREFYPAKADEILAKLPDGEMIVRWLMKTKAGDPENQPWDVQQKNEASELFGKPDHWISNARNVKALNDLEELAIYHMKGRGKRAGPQ
jgi:hypothetical protein